jgi:hypothetical protein
MRGNRPRVLPREKRAGWNHPGPLSSFKEIMVAPASFSRLLAGAAAVFFEFRHRSRLTGCIR